MNDKAKDSTICTATNTAALGNPETSPFHRGEQLAQQRLGVREKMESLGRRVIRSFLPEQHRKFYSQLSAIFVGHADASEWPWASILCGSPGFISTPSETTLEFNALPISGDPLGDAIQSGTRLGLLGIELSSRRRNRIAAHITHVDDNRIQLGIDQTFGNCPKYIQTRELEPRAVGSSGETPSESLDHFDHRAQQLIHNSDTFFVASYVNNGSIAASEGADVSHRGGTPGFIRIDSDTTLTIPDYPGNKHFNTLGNFVENSKAGLLFIDFETGNVLTVTGTVEILWDCAETADFPGAERLWRFHLSHGYWLEGGLPLRWKRTES